MEKKIEVRIKGKTIILLIWLYGKTFAKDSPFNIDIIAYDKYKSGFETPFVKVTLNEIFEKSNLVSLHTPLTNETIGMVNTSFIENLKILYFDQYCKRTVSGNQRFDSFFKD